MAAGATALSGKDTRKGHNESGEPMKPATGENGSHAP